MLSHTQVNEIMKALESDGKNFSKESGAEMLKLLNRASEIRAKYNVPYGEWMAWQEWQKQLDKFIERVSEEMKP